MHRRQQVLQPARIKFVAIQRLLQRLLQSLVRRRQSLARRKIRPGLNLLAKRRQLGLRIRGTGLVFIQRASQRRHLHIRAGGNRAARKLRQLPAAHCPRLAYP